MRKGGWRYTLSRFYRAGFRASYDVVLAQLQLSVSLSVLGLIAY